MKTKGPASVTQHREWMALHGGWEPRAPRPDSTSVDATMVGLSSELKLTEAELVAQVMMRGAYTPAERAQVETTARQAITAVVKEARRIGHDGRMLATNDLFHVIACRWSPSYGRALETARWPHEMTPATLDAARKDLRCAGLRLGPLFALARRAVRGLYKTIRTHSGLLRVRPRRKPRRDYRLLLADASPQERLPERRVTGEIEYSPVLSGPLSHLVMDTLESTRLILNGEVARAELKSMEAALDEAQDTLTVPSPASVYACGAYSGHSIAWGLKPRWTPEEIDALIALRKTEGPVLALAPVVPLLPAKGRVVIRTQMRQIINRRWQAATFGVEATGNTGTTRSEDYPESYDQDGEVEDPPLTYTTRRRGRMFRIETRSGRWITPNALAGSDVVSSMYQILAILLGDAVLEKKLQTRSAHQIVAAKVWPGDSDGPSRAKVITVPGGYGSTPHQISKNTGVPVAEVTRGLNALGKNIGRFREYTHAVAAVVDPYRGFEFTDPFDLSPVIWHPIRSKPRDIASNTSGAAYKLRTYVPVGKLNADGRAPVDRAKLRRQLAPMLVHALDSAFNGCVIMETILAGVPVVAINDCWLTAEPHVGALDGAIRAAGRPWLRSLGRVYDALLAYPVAPEHLEWMRDCKAKWEKRVAACETGSQPWPVFRTKPVRLATWE